jgi:peptide/nickel transport system ATP-binding protein
MEPVISFKGKDSRRSGERHPGTRRTPQAHAGARARTPSGEMPLSAPKNRGEQDKISARPGESDPAKTMTELGQGRQAASGRVKPAGSGKGGKTS